MLKRTSLLSAYNCLSTCGSCTPHSSCTVSKTSSSPGSTRSSRQTRCTAHIRQYATIRETQGPDFRDNMNWPCRRSIPSTPTPYEIFELERGAAYSKQKYYELVKLYHPDKRAYHTPGDGITELERLERYRLVVQAHEILSDPVKRKAYDLCGTGWVQRQTATRHTKGYKNPDGTEYGYGRDHDSTPFGNATWEDWERWYRRRDPNERQAYQGTYVNPNAFASFVIIMAVLSGVLQATRAGQYSTSLGEKAQTLTEETQQFMTSRAQQLSEDNLGSDRRIKHFLERRDPTKYGLKDEEEEMYRKHFSENHLLTSTTQSKPGAD